MVYKNVLITGGAGFVGSNLAIKYKENHPESKVTVLDNLVRRGSELNLPRLEEKDIKFIKGDVRNCDDIEQAGFFDCIIECSAECSVLAGYNDSAKYLIDTNLGGAVNCLEAAKKNGAAFIFLSTSRVYPIKALNDIRLEEDGLRLKVSAGQKIPGLSELGISEDFSQDGERSFYGASKLCAELLLKEYISGYGLKGVINRCGVIAGPWQFGKSDQGVVTLWVARHAYGHILSYIGYGGKQVRDVLHIDDLSGLIELQMNDIDKYNGQVFNVGGGLKNSVSLRELTRLCQTVTGKEIAISTVDKKRTADIPYYVTDISKISELSGWSPARSVGKVIKDIFLWIIANKAELKKIFS